MATLSNTVKWSSNTDELVKELQAASEQFSVSQTAVDKLVASFEGDKLIAAVAVASLEAVKLLRGECDTFVCLETPTDFSAVGQFFNDFSEISDQQVMEALSATA